MFHLRYILHIWNVAVINLFDTKFLDQDVPTVSFETNLSFVYVKLLVYCLTLHTRHNRERLSNATLHVIRYLSYYLSDANRNQSATKIVTVISEIP